MAVTIRHARPGDGDAIARTWLSADRYYADLDPQNFQVPRAEGLAAFWDDDIGQGAEVVRLDTYADSPVSVPFYERRMGYRRRAIVFEKPLRSLDL